MLAKEPSSTVKIAVLSFTCIWLHVPSARADWYRIENQQHKVRPEPKLIDAVWHENLKQMEHLLKNGVDPNTRSRNGTPALVWASMYTPQEVQLLLKYGAKVNLRGAGGQTALMIAGTKVEPEIAQILLDHGAKIGMKDARGSTALSLCISRNAYPSGDTRWRDPRIEKTRRILRRASGLK